MIRRTAAAVFLLFLTLGAPAHAKEKLPKFTNYVVDTANVVPDDAEQQADTELKSYQDRTSNQVAVAVVNTTGSQSIEDYSIDLARSWGVGQKGKDNGVLLLIAWKDHRLRIEVGRGLEGDLTDLESGRIIREQITPRLKANDVGGAILAGEQSIRAALGDKNVTEPEPAAPQEPAPQPGFGFGPLLGIAIPLILLFSLFGGGRRRRRRFGWIVPLFWGGGWGGGGWSGGGGGFGGGGGGFGGGGGGGFGGGGASGGW